MPDAPVDERDLAAVLANPSMPQTARAERDFTRLQATYPPRPPYGYSELDLFRRAADRATAIIDLKARYGVSGETLEFGAGDGSLGALLGAFGHACLSCDSIDWRMPYARHLPFCHGDICVGLPLAPGRFAMICSFNVIEHLADPAKALGEATRLVTPGGILYFDFGPAYCSPWGLHAYRTLNMPYPQFLFAEEFWQRTLRETHNFAEEKRIEHIAVASLNRWRCAAYHALWRDPALELLAIETQRDTRHLGLVLEYPECFCGRNLSIDDLVTDRITVILRKRS